MEEFTEDYSRVLLSQEWLVKVGNANSIPYLLKFGISEDKNTCFLLITDTRLVWTEVLKRNQLLRRWRQCNPSLPLMNEDEPFSRLQSLIRDLHSPGGISDANFDIVESRDADLAFELDCDNFKWRWDTYLLGPRTSADTISKHLILPLISLVHVSFYSADPVGELEEKELEKTVDKIGRAARRSIDIHVRQTLARPRITTSLQRISSLLGLVSPLPPINSEAGTPDLEGHIAALRVHKTTSLYDASRDIRLRDAVQYTAPPPSSEPVKSSTEQARTIEPLNVPDDPDSATESDSDDNQDALAPKAIPSVSQDSSSITRETAVADQDSEAPTLTHAFHSEPAESDSPPNKKLKGGPQPASDSDSDTDSRAKGRSQGSQGTSGGARSVVGRGVRQPLKRGGRRF